MASARRTSCTLLAEACAARHVENQEYIVLQPYCHLRKQLLF